MYSRVYFADMRSSMELNLIDKVGRLFLEAGLRDAMAPGDLVAAIYQEDSGRGQKCRREAFPHRRQHPLRGKRSNAVDHLQTAIENGFAYSVVNAPLIIADGSWM